MSNPSEICIRCPKELKGYCTGSVPSTHIKNLKYCPEGYWGDKPEQASQPDAVQIVYFGSEDDTKPFTFNPDPIDLEQSAVKDLHYTIYPARQDTTDSHIERLENSIDNFNGIRVCSLLVDDKTCEYRYESKLNKLFDIVNTQINDPKLRETKAFIESLSYLKSEDPKRVICFGHAKNQQERHPKVDKAINYWTDSLYTYCFDNWEGVLKSFKDGYSATGACKLNSGSQVSRFKWHYSGSFWWVRSSKLFSNPFWDHIVQNPFGSESYVGYRFFTEEADCLKFNHKDYKYIDFYSLDWWNKFGKD